MATQGRDPRDLCHHSALLETSSFGNSHCPGLSQNPYGPHTPWTPLTTSRQCGSQMVLDSCCRTPKVSFTAPSFPGNPTPATMGAPFALLWMGCNTISGVFWACPSTLCFVTCCHRTPPSPVTWDSAGAIGKRPEPSSAPWVLAPLFSLPTLAPHLPSQTFPCTVQLQSISFRKSSSIDPAHTKLFFLLGEAHSLALHYYSWLSVRGQEATVGERLQMWSPCLGIFPFFPAFVHQPSCLFTWGKPLSPGSLNVPVEQRARSHPKFQRQNLLLRVARVGSRLS